MKITMEINESENNGDGKVVLHYQVGAEKHTREEMLGEENLNTFHILLKVAKQQMWGSKTKQILSAVTRLNELCKDEKAE